MRFAFVIDQNRCIGCHACTVACKEEHAVPIGVNRTWVKYIEKGEFPTVTRQFAVLRCNHCDRAPCIDICPTVALFRREDGIVDFDANRCIGCKSCMQACPYDALYIDPASNTAAKCNFCAHRMAVNLQPACEIVCPVQAILSGDLDDKTSEVSRIAAEPSVITRKADKGTEPKLFYVGADADILRPSEFRASETHLWADRYPEDQHATTSGNPDGAPREVYDVPHPRPWGTKIAAYLWTKSIAAGVVMVSALLAFLGVDDPQTVFLQEAVSPIVALFFTALTTFLLVIDLKRPKRFHYLITKPNPKSWLVLGGYILMAYGAVLTLYLFFPFIDRDPPRILGGIAAIIAPAAAAYTALLFRQAKGRDLWQSHVFVWHLIVQAFAAGAAVLALAAIALNSFASVLVPIGRILAVSVAISTVLILGETIIPHGSTDTRRALTAVRTGAFASRFWGVVIVMGALAPVVIALWGTTGEPSRALVASASLLTLAGLWAFEDIWVRAGQAVPLS